MVSGMTADACWLSRVIRAARERDLIYFREHLREWGRLSGAVGAALLYLAAEYRLEGLFQLLWESGADVNAAYDRFVPLCGAAVSGDTRMIRLMLGAGARIDGDDSTVASPLMEAIMYGHFEAVRCLVECGADVNRYHHWCGKTPLDIALDYCQGKAVKFLRSHGALASYEMPVEASEEEQPVLRLMLNRYGRVEPFPYENYPDLGLKIWIAADRIRTKKYLVTTGMKDHTSAELIFELPFEWEFSDSDGRNRTFADLLYSFAKQATAGMPMDETQILFPAHQKRGFPNWPKDLMAVCTPLKDPEEACGEDRPVLCEVQLIRVNSGAHRKLGTNVSI